MTVDIKFDRQWTRNKIAAHKRQEAKCVRMEKALAALIEAKQREISIQRDIEYELRRTRNVAESNFERAWGYDQWRKL